MLQLLVAHALAADLAVNVYDRDRLVTAVTYREAGVVDPAPLQVRAGDVPVLVDFAPPRRTGRRCDLELAWNDEPMGRALGGTCRSGSAFERDGIRIEAVVLGRARVAGILAP